MLSINQMHAQVKLTEMLKAVNQSKYPLNIGQLMPSENGRATRGVSDGKLQEPATLNTFIGNATRLWNRAPTVIKKLYINQFCKERN